MTTERLVESYTQLRQTETHTLTRAAGKRMMTHDTPMVMRDGSSIRLIPSVSSPYLLPDLYGSDFALVQRGTGQPHRPGLAFLNGLLCVDGVGLAADVERWASWLRQPGTTLMFPLSHTDEGPAALNVAASPAPAERVTPQTATDPAAVAVDPSTTAVASRIYELSGLDDELLAALFKVQRETFNRWRTGVLTNPRVGNRRRLALLLRLLEDLAARDIPTRDWLLNTVDDESLTPYELLLRGRIDTVAYLAATIGTVASPARERSPHEDELEFGEDDVWEPGDPDDDE